jgi:hypothetical protein
VLQTTKCAFKDDASKQRCGVCGTTNTPCWRKGPSGPKTLCNRCGVHWYQNKDRWDHIVEELRATRVDETPEQASAPTRTVIKKKVRGVVFGVRVDDEMISLFGCCDVRKFDVINGLRYTHRGRNSPGDVAPKTTLVGGEVRCECRPQTAKQASGPMKIVIRRKGIYLVLL